MTRAKIRNTESSVNLKFDLEMGRSLCDVFLCTLCVVVQV